MAENCIMAEGHPLPARVGGSCDTAIYYLVTLPPIGTSYLITERHYKQAS
jgi:hypothetical protein